ncbi:inter-alpha-trypsin inhibitor heavy chain H4-like [Octopus sinensis]|uniref:Inter-alpha-trypsin inhibitor heavy chain H4-like n=1 Tax=Octopus sinensis TaxID=2607531 RepID=A0A6P7SDJ7_9MOLL|nr:inter-alpha-trypsin inhibitor heavy chain H4-like [Octopus sinensis]
MVSLQLVVLQTLLCSLVYKVDAETNTRKATLKSIHVISDIKYRFATTQVSMKYYNPSNSAVLADLHVNMPYNSFISNFSMEIDGNVTVGEVKEKSIAKDFYEHAIETGQSAGYVEVKHRFTNVFDISVNVEPQKYVVYNLTYQELLTRQNNKYRNVIHLSNGGIIDDFLVEVFITEPQDIIDLSVPKIKDDKLTNITDDGGLESALIEYISSREVYIKYNPSRKQQEEISEKDGVEGLLRVEYDVDRQNNPNLIYAVDGYFVHFFTPDSLPSLPKHIIFMLDVSGSMSGRKIEQLKEAMENILDKLDPELDTFLIGKFSNKVSWMMETFLTANETNKQLGKNYIQKLAALGGTNINAALLESIEKHKSALSTTKKSIIIFLTDGQATSGIKIGELIKKNVKEANKNVSLFTLGFGEDCDSKFLREIATENGGFSRKIYVDSDSRLQIENLYKEISNILLKDITFVYLDGAVKTSSTSFSSYFKGSELVVSGVLTQEYRPTINVSLTMTNRWGFDNEILELDLYGDNFTIYDDGFSQNSSLTNIQSFSEITEKTYAYLTLRQLLKEDRTTKVRKDILDLALKYKFVTPLTSMVVTKSRINEKLFEEDELQDFIPTIAALDMGRVMPILRLQRLTPRKLKKAKSSIMLHKRIRPTSPPLTSSGKEMKDTLPNIPGIFIKPFSCSNNLCLRHHVSCQVSTRILLLANFQANLFVHAFVKRSAQSNCLDTINRVILKRKRRLLFEVTADRLVKNGKEVDISNRTEINLNLKNFLSLKVFKTKKAASSETFLSLHFTTLKKITRARGILKKYIAKSACPHDVKNVLPKFKVNTNNPELKQCYFTT